MYVFVFLPKWCHLDCLMRIPLQVFIQLRYLLRYGLIFLCGGGSGSSWTLVLGEGELQHWGQIFF